MRGASITAAAGDAAVYASCTYGAFSSSFQLQFSGAVFSSSVQQQIPAVAPHCKDYMQRARWISQLLACVLMLCIAELVPTCTGQGALWLCGCTRML